MTWCYGLVEVESPGREKRLLVAEVYFNKIGVPCGYCEVDWKGVEEDKENVSNDIQAQLRTKKKFYVKRGKISQSAGKTPSVR